MYFYAKFHEKTIRLRKRVLFACFLLIICGSVSAQIDNEFWFVAPEIASSHGDSPIYLRISTMEEPAEITVRMPANLSFAPITQTILPNTTYTVNLTPWLNLVENRPADSVLKKGILITSDHDVTAYYECAHTNNPGIFSLKGQNALGTDFFIVSQNRYYNHDGQESFDIVATEDSTTVTITPSDNITGHFAGETFTVLLMKGETYSARATSTLAARTLAGSHITSDKPIAITWQDDSIYSEGSYDIVCDQTIPVNLLGKEYIAIKGYNDNSAADNDERVYILATQDSTILSVDGVVLDTLNTGEFYDHGISETENTAFIRVTKPGYALHLSGFLNEFGASILPQDSCTGSRKIGFARTNTNTFALLILTRNGNQDSFYLNGDNTIITAASFNPVPGTGGNWVYYRQTNLPTSQVPVGANLIENTKGTFHLGVLHKTGASSEYGYFSNFASLYLGADASICPGDSMVLDGGAYMNAYEWKKVIGGVWTLIDTNRFYTVHDTGYYACQTNGDFCTLMDTIHIVYYPNATVTLGADRTICEGTMTTFNPGLYVTYEWSTGETTQQITTGTGGAYWVRVTNNNGCIATDTAVVFIDSLPKANRAIAGPDTVCQAQIGVLYDVDSLSFSENYTWTLPSGASGLSDSASILLAFSASAASGWLTVSGHNACGDGPDTSLWITVKPLPGNAGTITGPDEVCPGETGVMYVVPAVLYATGYAWSLPAGATIVSDPLNDTITVDFSLSAVSGIITVHGTNDCGSGSASNFTLTVKPFPQAAGAITGPAQVCPGQTGVNYSIAPVLYADSYIWEYSGTGATLTNLGTTLQITFSLSAISGDVTVRANNECGDGPASPPLSVTVNPRPVMSLQICNNIVTRDAQPFILKGGLPLGGAWSGTGVVGNVFNPALVPIATDSATITYTYANVYGCINSAVQKIKVYPVQPFTCNGVLVDVRDNMTYPTIQIGTQCWMAANLNHGGGLSTSLLQRDNCIAEKYCYGNVPANCTAEGGLYSWDEMMQYETASGVQGLCPPRWHVPTQAEWNTLLAYFTSPGFAGSPLKYSGFSGFDALMQGARVHNRNDVFRSFATLLWTSDGIGSFKAWAHGMNEINPSVSLYPSHRSNAFGVRCIRD